MRLYSCVLLHHITFVWYLWFNIKSGIFEGETRKFYVKWWSFGVCLHLRIAIELSYFQRFIRQQLLRSSWKMLDYMMLRENYSIKHIFQFTTHIQILMAPQHCNIMAWPALYNRVYENDTFTSKALRNFLF